MNTPVAVIAELQSVAGKKDKENIFRREGLAKNTELFEGLNLAFNAMITFGVAKVPEKKAAGGTGLSFSTFVGEAQKLIDRSVTGNAARKLIESLMQVATKDEWNGWYRRILIKDMRAGFSESTVNKAVHGDWIKKVWVDGIAPQYRIPVFECQLAKDANDNPLHMTGKKILENKFDGSRVLTLIDPVKKSIRQFSRNGKEMLNFPHTIQQIMSVIHSFDEPTVLDGEIMSSSFKGIMRQINRKSNVQTADANLHVFDIISMDDFLAGLSGEPQHKRSERLSKWHTTHEAKLPNIVLSTYEIVDLDTAAGNTRVEEARLEAAEAGLEGIMLKSYNAAYECRRSTNWLKVKPIITVDLTIIDVEAGEEGKKNSEILGALVCKGVDQGKHILVNVGSGFTDAEREQFWRMRKKLIGQTVEIEADALSLSDTGEYYSLRFPRFSRFRDDK